MTTTPGPGGPQALPAVLVALMKGLIARDGDAALWQGLLDLETDVRDHVGALALELRIDAAEGFAYLAQRQVAEGEPELPRLVPRRPLSFHVSLLLALLRKKLAEHDAASGERRLVLSRSDIVELIRLFMPSTQNEARLEDRIDTSIKRVVEMGFLRQLKGQPEQLEVRRILKVFVDAQWLSGFAERLGDYRQHAAAGGAGSTDDA